MGRISIVHLHKMYVVLLFAFIMLSVKTASADSLTYVSSFSWKGNSGMEVEGNYAYCVFGPGLAIIDMSNPDSVHFISQLYLNIPGVYSYSGKIAIYDNIVFMSPHSDTIYIIDVQNPVSPSLLGCQKTDTSILDMKISDSLLFVAEGNSGIEIYDISNAASGSIDYVTTWDSPGSALQLQIQDTILFLADGDSGFQIVNISNLDNPEILGNLSIPYTYSLAVRDTIVLVSSRFGMDNDSLFVLNISDFSSIKILDRMYEACHLHSTWSIIINKNTAYLTGMDTWVIDITDPANIQKIRTIGPEANAITLYSDRIYRATLWYGGDLMIYDVQNPDSIIFLGKLEDYGFNWQVFFKEDYLILMERNPQSHPGRFLFYDVSSPASPTYSHKYSRPGVEPYSSHLWQDLFFISYEYPSFFEILDVSSPTSPTPLFFDSSRMDYGYFWICDNDSTIYMSGMDWIHIVDFSDPTSPESLSTIDIKDYTSWWAYSVCVVDSYLYVSIHSRPNLLIFNVADKRNPVFVLDFETAMSVKKFELNYPYLYLVEEGGRIEILNISNPTNLNSIGIYELGVNDIILKDSLLYACGSGGVEVLSLADPTYLVKLASYPTTGNYLTVDSNYIYVSNSSAVVVLKYIRTGVEEHRTPIEESPFLKIAPNPFRKGTVIEYAIPRKANVVLKIYDMAGRLVKVLVNEEKETGYYKEANWDTRGLATGIYFVKFTVGDYKTVKKLVLIN